MLTQDDKKRACAEKALESIAEGWIVGVGTGSTTNHFIDGLAAWRNRIRGAVASSEASAERLRRAGIRLVELSDVVELPVYVDGADEATRSRELIKGGGGALTREKIIAAASRRFLCIVDDSKLVARLGESPLPVEVIPLALRHVARAIEQLGGRPVARAEFVTDNGNEILDVHGLGIDSPEELELRLNGIPGVVENGIFARRRADALLVGTADGVTIVE
jgi:ribose 5-phosphate isomerase A